LFISRFSGKKFTGSVLFVLKPKKVDACKDKGVKINNGYGTRQIFSVTSG